VALRSLLKKFDGNYEPLLLSQITARSHDLDRLSAQRFGAQGVGAKPRLLSRVCTFSHKAAR
jgi:hypothetical protein